MSLGFSYMSFVIKKNNESLNESTEHPKNHFDIEPYNYIFNRGTAFLDSKFVTDNHLILERVLNNCHLKNPDVIDLLSYV